MARWSPLKDTTVLAVTNWRLWLLQLFGNFVIFLAFIWWLRLPDAHWWQVFFGVVLAALTAAAALVLHGGTLDYFHSAHQDRTTKLPPSLRRAFQHLPALVLWALIFFFLRWLIGKLDQYEVSLPGYLRSEFPAWLRRMISEPALESIYTSLLWLLRWVVLPGLLLPLALSCAGKGFRGFIAFGDWKRALRSLAFWLTLIVAAVLGVYCVEAIMGWRLDPKTATLAAEKTSLAFRLFFAYLLGIFSWLLAGSMLGRKVAGSSGQSGAQPL
jgi:hypothetical protein